MGLWFRLENNVNWRSVHSFSFELSNMSVNSVSKSERIRSKCSGVGDVLLICTICDLTFLGQPRGKNTSTSKSMSLLMSGIKLRGANEPSYVSCVATVIEHEEADNVQFSFS